MNYAEFAAKCDTSQDDTYQVMVSSDGCTNWTIDLPDSKGGRDDCLRFIAAHLPPKGCDFELIRPDGRCASYILDPVARRRRLLWQDLKLRT